VELFCSSGELDCQIAEVLSSTLCQISHRGRCFKGSQAGRHLLLELTFESTPTKEQFESLLTVGPTRADIILVALCYYFSPKRGPSVWLKTALYAAIAPTLITGQISAQAFELLYVSLGKFFKLT
jgi:hypothetical protein